MVKTTIRRRAVHFWRSRRKSFRAHIHRYALAWTDQDGRTPAANIIGEERSNR